MKILDAKAGGQRALVVVERGERSLRIISRAEKVEMERITSSELGGGGEAQVSISYEDPEGECKARALVLEFARKEDARYVEGILDKRALITKESVQRAIKRDVLLDKSYSELGKEEEGMFYKINKERIKKGLEIREGRRSAAVFGGKEVSERAKVSFVLESHLLMDVFFDMDLPLGEFVSAFFSGFVFTGSEKARNEVDRRVSRKIREYHGDAETVRESERPVLERLNIQSVLLQNARYAPAPPAPARPSEGPKSKAREQEVLSSRIISSFLEAPEKEEDAPDLAGVGEVWPLAHIRLPALAIGNLVPGRLEAVKKVSINKKLLRRMKEMSRLVYRYRDAQTEEVSAIVDKVVSAFRDEVRRHMSTADGRLAEEAVKRVLPTFYAKPRNGGKA